MSAGLLKPNAQQLRLSAGSLNEPGPMTSKRVSTPCPQNERWLRESLPSQSMDSVSLQSESDELANEMVPTESVNELVPTELEHPLVNHNIPVQ